MGSNECVKLRRQDDSLTQHCRNCSGYNESNRWNVDTIEQSIRPTTTFLVVALSNYHFS